MNDQLRKKDPVWIIIIVGLMTFLLLQLFGTQTDKVSYSSFLKLVEEGKISAVEINVDSPSVLAKTKDSKRLRVVVDRKDRNKFTDVLEQKKVQIEFTESGWMTSFLFAWIFPMAALFLIFSFLMRRMAGNSGGGIFSLSKSKAKMYVEQRVGVTFADVAGVEEAKEELQEIIEFLRDPRRFTRLGGRIPKGVLLMGPPGTGKTLLAKAVAGEAGVPFITIAGSDFVEMFVGLGAARVRDLFLTAKKLAPSIIFIDELDAVGKSRAAVGSIGGHDEREQTLQQLLAEMDGFEGREGVILLAATNRPEVLDHALLRPGRFDRQVVVDRPDVKGREAILRIHMRNVPIAPDVDVSILARSTVGLVGADLANMINEAALYAAKQRKNSVEMRDILWACDKVTTGVERKSLVMSPETKNIAAHHETGHTLVGLVLNKPMQKVTIMPRGRALGMTQQLGEEKHLYTRGDLLAQLAILLGGRAAEEVVLNVETTGAADDFRRATEIAESMVKEFGMSEQLGVVVLAKPRALFLGHEVATNPDVSQKTLEEADAEIRRILKEQYERAKSIIRENNQKLAKIVQRLLEKETLDAGELKAIFENPV